MRDAWIALTAIAAHTRKVKIGSSIVNPYSSSPVEITMRAASLQEFSGGRFLLGIGAGAPETLAWIGLNPEKQIQGLTESILIIKKLLAGDSAKYDGEVFKGFTDQVRLTFGLHGYYTPIYIGGQGPKALQLMGELGDGALPMLFRQRTPTMWSCK